MLIGLQGQERVKKYTCNVRKWYWNNESRIKMVYMMRQGCEVPLWPTSQHHAIWSLKGFGVVFWVYPVKSPERTMTIVMIRKTGGTCFRDDIKAFQIEGVPERWAWKHNGKRGWVLEEGRANGTPRDAKYASSAQRKEVWTIIDQVYVGLRLVCIGFSLIFTC